MVTVLFTAASGISVFIVWASEQPSLFPENKIQYMTPTHMFATGSAVIEDVAVPATGFFEGITENRKTVESPVLVNGVGQFLHGRSQPGPVQVNGFEWVAEDAAKDFNFQGSVSLVTREGRLAL
jgi:hypothetical protein